MSGKTAGFSFAGLGILLIAAAAIIRFVVLPTQAQLPDDLDSQRTYEGTVSVLNAEALATGDLANLFLTNVPVAIDRRVEAVEVDGGEELVKDSQIMTAPDGSAILASSTLYSVDRKTMESVPDFSGNDLPDRTGLVIGWPIGTEDRDYVGWSDDPMQTVNLAFAGEEERVGLDTYKFTASSGPQKIVDPNMLANFPPALPQALIAQLAPTLGLPEEMTAQLGQLLPALPDPVPLSYTYEFEAEYWVDPATGVLVDIVKHDKRDVVLESDLLPGPVPLTTVYDLNYVPTQEAIDDAKADVDQYGGQLSLFGTTVPLLLGVLGLGALYMGARVMRKES
jgi:hypothetical protein